MKDIRIVFMGTPDFAVGILKKLVEEGKNIVGVITSPDRPAGRGRKLRQSAVKEYADAQGLTLLQPPRLKNPEFLKELNSLKADLQIVVAFRMLPKLVWDMPSLGTFNLHASLLPNYRGAAPINWAIINGEHKTGVTTFFIDEKIDTGAIIESRECNILPEETVGSLHDKLMILGADLVVETVNLIEKGMIKTEIQEETIELKEAPKLSPENTRIDWCLTGNEINSFIRGLNPYPGAWTFLQQNDQELKAKIYSCEWRNEDHSLEPGMIQSGKKELKIALAEGYLYIDEIQIQGKRKMDVKSLLNGFHFENDAKMV